MMLKNEFILVIGVNPVVHSDKCKCTKRNGDQLCVYGYTKEEILEYCYGVDKNSVKFAKCSEVKLESINK
jgi:hypothetical protein